MGMAIWGSVLETTPEVELIEETAINLICLFKGLGSKLLKGGYIRDYIGFRV